MSVLALLALLFSFASISPAQAALPKVALLGSETGDRLTDIVSKITAAGTGLYQVTNLTGCALATPTLSTLQQYDSVMVWSDCLFANSTTLGNVLADYVDGGGHVVLASHAWWNYTHSGTLTLDIRGRFASGGYNPLQLGSSGVGGPIWSLVPDQPNSALLAGVNTVTVLGIDNTTSIAPGATLVAHVAPGGHPLVVYKGNVVALNFFPASSHVQGGGWNASTDGARLIANALLFNLTPPDTSAPTASPSPAPAANGAGWNNTDVTITWNWTDNAGGSGIDNANCTTSSVSTGEGTIALAATCKDLAGNTGNASYTVKVDKTAPTITAATTTAPNGAGWYNGDVTVHFTCADAGSGVGACPADQTLSTEGAAVASTAQTVTDAAGNTSDASNVVTVQINKTAPTITAAATTAPNGAGWYNGDVTVHFTCADAGSGVGACPADQTLSAEGTAVAATAQTVTDAAGNTSDASNVVTVQIDKTAPTLNPAVSPNPVPLMGTATVTSGAADALSGLASQSCGALDTSTAGNKNVTCTATDSAGNTNSADASYAVLTPAEQINNLLATIGSFNLNGGTANSLTSKLDNAAKSLGKNNTNAACGQVNAFINQINALSGNKLTTAQAAQLLASANQIKTSIGCP